MKKKTNKLFVLDTNVLMHDPSSIFNFQEHDVFIPMIVLEELDNAKKGLSEISRNVRQVTRYLDMLVGQVPHEKINEGIALNVLNELDTEGPGPTGKIYFQTQNFHDIELPILPGHKADHTILVVVHALKEAQPEREIILVSKDINMRIKANVLSLIAQDYYTDRALEDLTQLHTGTVLLDDLFWESQIKNGETWKEENQTYYRVKDKDIKSWYPNDCLYTGKDPNFMALLKVKEAANQAVIKTVKDYTHPKNAIWGVNARNLEQNFALNLLMDPDIDFVTLEGIAGTGKTLLALAAGLAQCFDDRRYREIIVTRVTVPLGEDIGFLPGTEEEKMTPWMGALLDNLEVLMGSQSSSTWEDPATQELLHNRVKIRSLNFMRGRTFLSRYIIIDEAQNLTAKQMKTLITRAGPGTKIVCLGDVAQIDTPYLTPLSSGLTYAIHHFRAWDHSGHITLTHGERSRLADYAAENL